MMKIIKIPAKLPLYLFIAGEELVDNTFGEGLFFRQTWDSSIHQWVVLEEGWYNDELVGYCSAQINQEESLGILKTTNMMYKLCLRDGVIPHLGF